MSRIIVFIGLLVGVYALNDLNSLKQGSVFEEDTLALLKNSSVGRSIVKLAELSSMTRSFDFGRLFSAIDSLDTELKDRKNDENTLFASDYQQYVSDVEYYQNQVTQYSAESSQHTFDIEGLTRQLSYLENYLNERRLQLDSTLQLQGQLVETMEHEAQVFGEQLADYDSAINVLDQAVTLLQSILDEPSLLELKKDLVHESAMQMEQSFGSFKHQRFFYQPMTQALVQMATEGIVDQVLLKKVIGFMNNLRTSLNAGRQTLTYNYQSQRNDNQALLTKYNGVVSALQNKIIPTVQKEIQTTNENINTKQGLLKDSQSNLADAQDNLLNTQNGWLQRQTYHKTLIDEYNNELGVLVQAITALERGGIRRQ